MILAVGLKMRNCYDIQQITEISSKFTKILKSRIKLEFHYPENDGCYNLAKVLGEFWVCVCSTDFCNDASVNKAIHQLWLLLSIFIVWKLNLGVY